MKVFPRMLEGLTLSQEMEDVHYGDEDDMDEEGENDEDDDVERYEDTAELRAEDVEEVLWYFTPFLSEGERGKEEEIYDAHLEMLCDHEYLKGSAPDDVSWDGWQREVRPRKI